MLAPFLINLQLPTQGPTAEAAKVFRRCKRKTFFYNTYPTQHECCNRIPPRTRGLFSFALNLSRSILSTSFDKQIQVGGWWWGVARDVKLRPIDPICVCCVDSRSALSWFHPISEPKKKKKFVRPGFCNAIQVLVDYFVMKIMA